jgi:predicted DNA-binding protein
VKDYPQVSMRLPAEIRDRLRGLSIMRAQPQWRIVCDAIGCYLRDLPAAERRRLATVGKSLRGRR